MSERTQKVDSLQASLAHFDDGLLPQQNNKRLETAFKMLEQF